MSKFVGNKTKKGKSQDRCYNKTKHPNSPKNEHLLRRNTHTWGKKYAFFRKTGVLWNLAILCNSANKSFSWLGVIPYFQSHFILRCNVTSFILMTSLKEILKRYPLYKSNNNSLLGWDLSHPAIACSKLTMETLKQGMKDVQS